MAWYCVPATLAHLHVGDIVVPGDLLAPAGHEDAGLYRVVALLLPGGPAHLVLLGLARREALLIEKLLRDLVAVGAVHLDIDQHRRGRIAAHADHGGLAAVR